MTKNYEFVTQLTLLNLRCLQTHPHEGQNLFLFHYVCDGALVFLSKINRDDIIYRIVFLKLLGRI